MTGSKVLNLICKSENNGKVQCHVALRMVICELLGYELDTRGSTVVSSHVDLQKVGGHSRWSDKVVNFPFM